MFDNNQTNQPVGDNSAIPSTNNQSAEAPITPNTAIPPTTPQVESINEPEDIFDKSSPSIDNAGKDNPFKPTNYPNQSVENPIIPELKTEEPSIKAPNNIIAQKNRH